MLQLKEPYGFIYLTTNLVNGKTYIGQKKFTNNWKTYLGSGIAINRAIRKYGRDNFYREIIHIAYSKEELNELEKDYIQFHNACNSQDYYNVASGGDGGNTLAGKSEEELIAFRKRCSKNNKGKNNYWYGKGDLLKGENNPFYGRKHSEETRKKIRKKLRGRTMSDEARRNMSLAQKGRIHTTEARLKMSQKCKTKRQVICITTGETFKSVVEASKRTGVSRQNISACCRGKLKSAGKMQWAYLEKYNKELGGCVVYE